MSGGAHQSPDTTLHATAHCASGWTSDSELPTAIVALSLFDFNACTAAGILFGTRAALVSPVSIRQYVKTRGLRRGMNSLLFQLAIVQESHN
jgi:hypothetical protein